MTRDRVLQVLRPVLSTIIESPVEDIRDHYTLADDLGMDSLDAIELELAIEERLPIAIGPNERDNLVHGPNGAGLTVAALADMLVARLTGGSGAP